jgi:hypothetical protein
MQYYSFSTPVLVNCIFRAMRKWHKMNRLFSARKVVIEFVLDGSCVSSVLFTLVFKLE